MNIGVLGTGSVGETIGGKLVSLGHSVKLGSRSASNEKAAAWVKATGKGASAGTFADAAAFGEVLFNCTKGEGAVPALEAAGAANLKGKVILDLTNPLDFSKGMPPTLFVGNNDSLGETLQRKFPDARVVKTLNTVSAPVMVNPGAVNGGDHTMFMAGNDADAKAQARKLLAEFGWKDVLDLGDISASRGLEAYLHVWLRMWGALKIPMFNVKVAR